MSSYWNKFTKTRVTRRRALAASGATALSAAFLAACGGDDDSSSDSGATGGESSGASGLLSEVTDESKSVIRGGVLKNISSSKTLGFDPHAGSSGTVVEPTYSTLWIQQAGHLSRAKGEILGDLAESWEYSPDKLTLTAKLNAKAHFSPQAPTNGRVVDADDVVFTWNRVLGISAQAGNLASSKNPNAPIESITAVDPRTVRIKMARPDATVMALLSSNFQGYMNIAPKEGANPGVLDLSTTVRGSGPWYLDSLDDLQRVFKRNPGFGQDSRGVPYVDQVTDLLVPEYAAAMAQFRTGAGYTFTPLAEDVVSLKKDLPQLEVRQADFTTTRARPFFGLKPGSTFVDKRVRQAFVYTWDRDLYADVIFNVSKYEEAGLAVDTFWETAIQSTNWEGWALDGRSKDFGPNGKYLTRNLEEAKKLLSAAGNSGTVDFVAHSPSSLGGQASFDQIVEVLLGMAVDSGLFRATTRNTPQWAPTWVQEYHQGRAESHEGVAFTQSSLIFDPVNEAALWYHPSSGSSKGSDDTIRSLIDKAKGEFDDGKRRGFIQDLQRHEAEVAFFPRISGATGFTVTWPTVRNVNVWRGGTPSRPHCTVFLDPSKAPQRS